MKEINILNTAKPQTKGSLIYLILVTVSAKNLTNEDLFEQNFLKVGFQNVVFLRSEIVFHITFLKNCGIGSDEGLETAHVLKCGWSNGLGTPHVLKCGWSKGLWTPHVL